MLQFYDFLGEVGSVVSKNELKKPEPSEGAESKVEEEFTVARLYVSKMKSEVKNLVNRASMLETGNLNFQFDKKKNSLQYHIEKDFFQNFRIFLFYKKNCFQFYIFYQFHEKYFFNNLMNFLAQDQGLSKIDTMEKELSEARLLVGQYEAKMKSLNEAIKEADGTKRQLEEQVDTLNEEVSKLQAAGNFQFQKNGFFSI